MPGPDREMEAEARNDLPRRMEKFANTFVAIAKEAMEMVKLGKK